MSRKLQVGFMRWDYWGAALHGMCWSGIGAAASSSLPSSPGFWEQAGGCLSSAMGERGLGNAEGEVNTGGKPWTAWQRNESF